MNNKDLEIENRLKSCEGLLSEIFNAAQTDWENWIGEKSGDWFDRVADYFNKQK